MNEIIKATLAEQRQILGTQLVKNHDFRDFTGKVFPETKGKWIFDDVYHSGEGTGKTLNQDVSGCGNDLTAVNFSANFADELESGSEIYKNGNVLNFNGTNQFMRILDAQGDDFEGDTKFTVETWINVGSGNDCFIFYKLSTGLIGFGFQYSADANRIRVYSGGWKASSVISIEDSNWHHVAFVFDTDKILFYCDGSYLNTVTSVAQPAANNGDVRIGRSQADVYYNDKMASVFYHAQILTVDEMKEQCDLGVDWLWNRNGTIQKDNFKQLVSGAGVVSQTVVGMTAGKTYKRALIGAGDTNEVINILNTNDEIELEDDTFSLASVRELQQDLAVKTPLVHDTIIAAIVEDTLEINIEE